MAHVFVSYSRQNAPAVDALVADLHGERHTTWFDKRDIRIGDEWARALGRGIADADVFLVAVSTEAIASEWVQREIAIALEQHKPVLPVILGAMSARDLPASLKKRHAIALFPDRSAGIAKLLEDLRPVRREGGRIPFLVDHPRLTGGLGLLGRDEELRRLHESLETAGPTGIRPAGISGMGGIGKTQLAVEYAYRYRYFYPGGVFMLNAAAENWDAELAGLALALHLPPNNPDQPVAMVAALLGYLDAHRDALVIFDNVVQVGRIRHDSIGRGARVVNLPCRLLFTTRQAFEPGDLQAIELDVLPAEDAQKLLASARDELHPDDPDIARVCQALGCLPLALELGRAFLKRKPKATPAAYLGHLERRGLDATHREASLKKGDLAAYYEASVVPALKAQWRLLESKDTVRLLEVMALHDENARAPEARVGLMSAWRDDPDGVVTPLGDALRDARAANLLERLGESVVRLHPVVRDFVRHARKLDLARAGGAAQKRLIDAYEDMKILEEQCARRGVVAVARDLGTVLAFSGGAVTSPSASRIRSLLRVLQREHHVLRDWRQEAQPAFLAQQVANRASDMKFGRLAARALERIDALKAPHVLLCWRSGPVPGLSLVGHAAGVNGVAITGRGNLALTVSLDGTLKEWDLGTGEMIRTASICERGVDGLALSRDGRTAVLGPAGEDVVIWDVDRWEIKRLLKGNGYAGWAVALAPDGPHALVASGPGLKLWDTTSGKRLKTLRTGHHRANVVTFTPDGKRAVSGGQEGEVVLWDVEAGERVRTLGRHRGSVWAIAVSPDGHFAVSGADGDNLILIWDLVTRSQPTWLEGHTEIVRALQVTPDGRYLWSGSGDRTLRLWDLKRKRRLITVQAHSGYIRGLAVSSDGLGVLTASGDGTARLWDRREIEAQDWPESHADGVTFLGISPGGEWVISASMDGTLQVRAAATGALVWRSTSGRDDQIRSAAMAPDGRRLLLGEVDALAIWDGGKVEPYEIGDIELPDAMAISPDGRLGLCGSFQREVTLWDLERGKKIRTLLRDARRGIVFSVALSPDGRYAFAAVGGEGLVVWDLHGKGRSILRKDRHDHLVVCAPDGRRLICASSDGTVEVLTIPAGRIVKVLETAPVSTLAMSPTGRYLVTGSPQATLRVWDVANGDCLATYGADSRITALALGPDGTSVAIGDDVGRIRMLRFRRLRLE